MKTGLIYKITNKITNKSYIGQTIYSVKKRYKGHLSAAFKYNSGFYIHRSMRKYGEDNFKIEIIESNIPILCDLKSKKTLLYIRERYWINYYDTYNNGYNLTEGDEFFNSTGLMTVRNKITGEVYSTTVEEWKINDDIEAESKGRKIKCTKNYIKSGKHNSRAKRIDIYNNKNELMFECHGNFKKVCMKNNLPRSFLNKTYLNNTKICYNKYMSISYYNSNLLEFEGWYARII